MQTNTRKAAIAAYKERKSVAGIYALCCIPSGQIWIGHTPDIETVQNRLDFTLRFGGGLNAALETARRVHGPVAFVFEPLERLEEQKTRYLRDALLKERAAFWRAQFGALQL